MHQDNDHKSGPRKNNYETWAEYEQAAREQYGVQLALKRLIRNDKPLDGIADWRLVRTIALGIILGVIPTMVLLAFM